VIGDPPGYAEYLDRKKFLGELSWLENRSLLTSFAEHVGRGLVGGVALWLGIESGWSFHVALAVATAAGLLVRTWTSDTRVAR